MCLIFVIQFNSTKIQRKIQILIDFKIEINVITFVYILKQDFIIKKIDNNIRNINGITFTPYEMITIGFIL